MLASLAIGANLKSTLGFILTDLPELKASGV